MKDRGFEAGVRWNRVLAAISLAVFLALAACSTKPAAAPPPAEIVTGIRLETIRLQTVPIEIEAPGTVASFRTAQISARTMGTVQQVTVREGDTVKSGHLLIQLDEREMTSRQSSARAALDEAAAAREEAVRSLAAAQAQAEIAEKTLERYRALREKNAVAPQEFDEVEAKQRFAAASVEAALARQRQAAAAYQRAEAEGHVAETMSSYSRIVAPFDGLVLRRNVEPGAMAMPGELLLVIEDSSRYRLEANVPSADAAAIIRGSKARVRLDALPGREFEGTVAEIEPAADPQSQTARVRLDLPRAPGVRSGLFGRAWFARGERTAITVPRTAILQRGQLRGVYVASPDGLLRWRIVTVAERGGERNGERLEVLSGLGETERIVLDPGSRELDGKRVDEP
ncbi:MAG: efflux RND transporter periplasmic adaptor subunit [Acidobacteria bacterium]|nr:efflux RND transporter periplasmic adaptor subunit [Acidobacteriota bacterium]